MSSETSRFHGGNVDVEYGDPYVVKTDRTPRTIGEASLMATRLTNYMSQLGREPLPHARVHEISLVVSDRPKLWLVRHTADRVWGSPLGELPPNWRQEAVSIFVAALCNVSTVPGSDKSGVLTFGVDVGPGAISMNGVTPTLVDTYPPLSLGPDGQLEVLSGMSRSRDAERRRLTEQFTHLDQIVPDLVLGSAPPELSTADRREWCMGALPTSATVSDAALRNHIEQAVDLRLAGEAPR